MSDKDGGKGKIIVGRSGGDSVPGGGGGEPIDYPVPADEVVVVGNPSPGGPVVVVAGPSGGGDGGTPGGGGGTPAVAEEILLQRPPLADQISIKMGTRV